MKKATGEVLTIYETTAPQRFDALVLILDLEGFTLFCAKPQIERRIPIFLNRVFSLVSRALVIDDSFNDTNLRFPLYGELPIHIKFLGDGALIIWRMPENQAVQINAFLELLNHLFIVKTNYQDLFNDCAEEFGLPYLPSKIRFGITFGEVQRLQAVGTNRTEYVGFSINLASRLQSYCRGLGLIASARIGIEEERLEHLRYKKVLAKALSGFEPEVVIVDEDDYNALNNKERTRLFREL